MKARFKKRAIEIDITKEKSILFHLHDIRVTNIGISWYFMKSVTFISIDFVIVGVTIVFK